MLTRSVTAVRWAAGAAVLLGALLTVQVVAAFAAGPDAGVYAMPAVVAQGVPTPTPFRFLTPTPITPRSTTSTTTTTSTSSSTTTATPTPRTGGFPLELALPALAGGLAAIGGGSFILRRKPAR